MLPETLPVYLLDAYSFCDVRNTPLISFGADPRSLFVIHHFDGLVFRENWNQKTPYWMEASLVSCRFSLKLIHWLIECSLQVVYHRVFVCTSTLLCWNPCAVAAIFDGSISLRVLHRHRVGAPSSCPIGVFSIATKVTKPRVHDGQ